MSIGSAVSEGYWKEEYIPGFTMGLLRYHVCCTCALRRGRVATYPFSNIGLFCYKHVL